MKKIVISINIVLMSFSGLAFAQNVDMELAAANGCTACHTLDTKLIGPSYQEVHEKYKDDPNAADMLFKKIKEGGSGVWGEIPMTPHPHVDDDVIKTLVAQILGKQ